VPEQFPVALARQTVERVRVLAHRVMGHQGHGLTGRRQLEQGGHGHLHLVADAADVDENLRGLLVHQRAR
jgi:hypothetical protein